MPIVATETPTYQPAMRIIESITNADPAVITTTFDHDFITGEIVRIVIPKIPHNAMGFGMGQIDGLKGTITVTGTDTFTIDIDTTVFDIFNDPGTFDQYAQVVPIGESNDILTAATVNTLPTGNR